MQSYTWDAVPAEQVAGNIERRIISGEKEMLVRWAFTKGTHAARHNHPHEQVVLMVSGRLKLTVGDEAATLGPGDIVLIPPDVPHEADALEDTVVIDIFSPPREDFLTGEQPAYMRE